MHFDKAARLNAIGRRARTSRKWAAMNHQSLKLLGLAVLMSSSLATATPLALLDRGGSQVSIESYASNIVRITVSLEKDLALAPPGYGLIAAADNTGWSHRTTASGDEFSSAVMSVTVDARAWPGPPSQTERYFASSLPPVSLTVAKTGGEPLLRMNGWEMAPHSVNGEKTFRVGAVFHSPGDEHYYGLGQNQEGILDYRGRTIDCKHSYDAPAGETVCVPFMVTNKGYGIVWDNPSNTMISPGLHGQTTWRSAVGERVSYFVIAGTTLDELYAGYRKLSGVTPLPPKAAFGYIQSKARYETQQQVLEVADGYRSRGYPLDVIVVDWFYWTRMGQLDIDPNAFPDPQAMNRKLHEQGVHTLISVWPRFERGSRYFDFLAAKGWLLADKNGTPVDGLAERSDRAGALIDSTNPEAREWYWDRIRDNIAARGFDWFWLDETEPDLVPDGYFYSIGSGDRYHNLFPLLHTQGVAEGSRRDRPDKRNLILARAAYLGAQRHGSLFWSSDINSSWEALRRQIPTGLNFTASGLAYWGNDVGGWLPPLQAKDYPELITRWYEYGTFTPTMRAHGLRKATEVWSYGAQAEAVISKYLRLRYALLPYIYSLGKRTYDTGAPFMRALFMDFPNDPNVANTGDEYMFGPAFLVAPVTEPGRVSRPVYLPAGRDWYNYWTNEHFAGGQTITAAAPIDIIPLFVAAGSIIPMGSAIQNTSTPQKLTQIRVYPGRAAEFALYDDDGETYAYEKGKSRLTRLLWDDARGQLTSKGDSLQASLAELTRIIH